jgi:N-acetylglutamate synthase-like GNAT family acetyltransferase
VVVIERTRDADRPAIEALLRANGLPLDGLRQALPLSVAARDEGRIVGCAAVEAYGTAGLLRSVCVAESHRSTGIGRSLVAEAEALAAGTGIDELFLLTETAAAWFPRLGYVAAARDEAPADMAASPEFVSACPVGAAVFRKRLEPVAAPG